MVGRPPKVLSISPTSPIAGAPSCPKWLGPVARKKWKSVVALMTDAGIISKLDGDLLADYCEAFARRQDALSRLNGEYVIDGPKGSYQNPILHVANKALDQMIKIGGKLGLDKLSASRISTEKPQSTPKIAQRDRHKGPPPPQTAGRIG